jgi:hypothetical protein
MAQRLAKPSYKELQQQLAALQKENGNGELTFKVGEKGGVSVYGMGRFPVTLYYEQWMRLFDAIPRLKTYLQEQLKAKTLKLRS